MKAATFWSELRDLLESVQIVKGADRNKGSGRGHNFRLLVDGLHTAESNCTLLQKGKKEWNQSELLSDYDAVDKALRKYVELSVQKLGRGQASERRFDMGTIEKGLQVMSSALRLVPGGQDELRKTYQEFEDVLHKAYYKTSKDVFDNIFSQVKTLAKDLKKEVPKIQIDGENIEFSHDGATLLNNVFTHLVRNFMDHGLEDSKTRVSQGKSPEGTLSLKMEPGPDGLSIHFKDDGAGLRLKTVKDIGVAKRLISQDENDPTKIADLIFSSGFSTAQSVTEISGRGVGMDAVRSYIEKAGGKLTINLLGKADSTNEAVPVEFILTLDSKMFTIVRHEVA